MKAMNFNSAVEMLDAIQSGTDLYSPEIETYVFIYTDNGSICYYSIDEEFAEELEKISFLGGEEWSAYLGIGGHILDSDEWYVENNQTRPDYLESPIEWCEKVYKAKWFACGYQYYESKGVEE